MSDNLSIRKANKEDNKSILRCMLLAMEDIACKFLATENKQYAADFLLHFICQEGNMYSWQNCWVVEKGKEVIAAANIYEGAQLEILRKPVINFVRQHFNPEFDPEDETQAGEFYIDSLGVLTEEQGKGYGTTFLQFLIEEFVVRNKQNLGLLVREENPGAKKLYLRMGFKAVDKRMLAGKKMEHLQISL
ncbi:GNAT family N-acetyltransferase [Maribellus sp. YY47]|uniref:GNAT family N-acetyltransferase n=1 Tax=Maribellus sp. YY47 TaxID=2929486 RepID=UPI002001194F|nr:GNAT family N-acetyltransferase [Maribellus sp. YY47]MCK3685417.1 GNAT family N-acetyltransferase [Maribellus sp. YY47]